MEVQIVVRLLIRRELGKLGFVPASEEEQVYKQPHYRQDPKYGQAEVVASPESIHEVSHDQLLSLSLRESSAA